MAEKWVKPFRDESDFSSEDLSLTDETLRVRRAGSKRPICRSLGEAVLVFGFVVLAGIVTHDRLLPRTGLLPFGLVSMYLSLPTAFAGTDLLIPLPSLVPQKVVTFSNTAGFGPERVWTSCKQTVFPMNTT